MEDEVLNPHRISEVTCACGCDTLMPQTVVDRGWRYLRGHKPSSLKVAKKPQGVIASTGPGKIREFFALQLEELRAQRKDLEQAAQELLTQAKLKMEAVKQLDHRIELTKTTKMQLDAYFATVHGAQKTLTAGTP